MNGSDIRSREENEQGRREQEQRRGFFYDAGDTACLSLIALALGIVAILLL